MQVDFQTTYTARCDIDDALDDYNSTMDWNPDYDPVEAIQEAINENLICPNDVEIPEEVFEQFVNALKMRIGGIQMKMGLD